MSRRHRTLLSPPRLGGDQPRRYIEALTETPRGPIAQLPFQAIRGSRPQNRRLSEAAEAGPMDLMPFLFPVHRAPNKAGLRRQIASPRFGHHMSPTLAAHPND